MSAGLFACWWSLSKSLVSFQISMTLLILLSLLRQVSFQQVFFHVVISLQAQNESSIIYAARRVWMCDPTHSRARHDSHMCIRNGMYGMATIGRLLKILSLFCRISSLLQGSLAKETYTFKAPTHRSHPIAKSRCACIHDLSYIQPIAERVAQNFEMISQVVSRHQNSAHGIYDQYHVILGYE